MSDTTFKIDKHVPIPLRKLRSRYPFDKMEIGDSFFVAADLNEKMLKSLKMAMYNFARPRHGYRFTVLAVDGGYRVWRVECKGAVQ